MRFAKGVHTRLTARGLYASEIVLTLERLEAAVPHLVFDNWRGAPWDGPWEADTTSFGEVLWKPNYLIEVRLNLKKLKFSFRVNCRRHSGPVSKGDYQFLLCLASEAVQMLESELGGAMSLLDFGTYAVAEEIERIGGCDEGVLTAMRFIRSLTQETYENQNLSYGLIFSNAYVGSAPLSDGFSNKRLKRLTDGFSTALVVDGVGNVSGYTALSTPENEGLRLTRRPWWSSGIATMSDELDGVGVALVRNGDIIVLKHGQLLFSQRAGYWQIWNHTAILARLKSAWVAHGPRSNVNRVLHYLYHVALDLSFRRSGGLLVVLNTQASLRKLLVSTTDQVGTSRRGAAERAIDDLLKGSTIQTLDRRICADIASLDGAVVVNRQGTVLAYGAMTKAAAGARQGARTRAAAKASNFGVVIKVSSDGQISFFSQGRAFLEL